MNKHFTTPVFVANFPSIFEMSSSKGEDGSEGALRYSIQMIFTPKDFTEREKAVWAAMEVESERIMREVLKPVNPQPYYRDPFRKGSKSKQNQSGLDYEKYPYLSDDNVVANASNYSNKPGVVDIDRNPILDKSQIYSGCYCVAVIELYASGAKATSKAYKNPGVSASIIHVMKIADGKPLTAPSVTVDDAFADFTPVVPQYAITSNDL
jgi:hypothetical protein